MDTEDYIATGGDMDDFQDIQEGLEQQVEGDLEARAEDGADKRKPQKDTQDPLQVLYKHHPECILDYQETVAMKLPLQSVPPNVTQPADPLHRSQPFLTLYEKTKILGFRTNQLAQGARAFVTVPPHVTSTLEIARMELEQRRLPFIIKRPMPDGSFEYWRLSDLMIL